jgi:hypothetical protein
VAARWQLGSRRLVARIEEISYLLSKHKYDKIGETDYTHEKTTRELKEGRVPSSRRGADC